MDKYNDQRLSPRVGMVRGMFCALYPFALLCLHYIRFRGRLYLGVRREFGAYEMKRRPLAGYLP